MIVTLPIIIGINSSFNIEISEHIFVIRGLLVCDADKQNDCLLSFGSLAFSCSCLAQPLLITLFKRFLLCMKEVGCSNLLIDRMYIL